MAGSRKNWRSPQAYQTILLSQGYGFWLSAAWWPANRGLLWPVLAKNGNLYGMLLSAQFVASRNYGAFKVPSSSLVSKAFLITIRLDLSTEIGNFDLCFYKNHRDRIATPNGCRSLRWFRWGGISAAKRSVLLRNTSLREARPGNKNDKNRITTSCPTFSVVCHQGWAHPTCTTVAITKVNREQLTSQWNCNGA